MIENLQIRQAGIDDVDFIIEAIIESEKSSSNMISSCNIFALEENEFKEIIRDLLMQDMEGYDYSLSGFLVSELNGEYVGASGSWLEGIDGTPSGLVKATVLFPYLDRAKIKEINKNTQIIKGLTLPRETGTLQLEHGYVREKFRRQGVFTKMIRHNIYRNLSKYSYTKAQVILFKENYKSYNANLKVGYEVVEERKVEAPEILKFFPYSSKVLMEFNRDKIEDLVNSYRYNEPELSYSIAC